MTFRPRHRTSFSGPSDEGLSHLAEGIGRAGSRIGSTLKIVAVVGGGLVIAVVTFVAVAAWQIMTSSEVRMIAGQPGTAPTPSRSRLRPRLNATG